MPFRDYLERINSENRRINIHEQISPAYEIAGVMKNLEPNPVFFNNVIGSDFRVAGNLFCSKDSFADYFNIKSDQIIPTLTNAIENPTSGEQIQSAPCQEVVRQNIDLDDLPILKHCEGDGGNYITSGIYFTKHPKFGQNADYHRCMQISKSEMAVRVVTSRHFDIYLNETKELDVAICIGNSPNVLAAAAISVDLGVNELDIANSLEPLSTVKAITSDILIPADTEIVIEGTVYLERLNQEGPFVDLTETLDQIRYQPTLVVKVITHRNNPIWQALLPGGLEHKLLMGMPREPTIFQKVNQVVKCLDVNINPGGCSWLHAIIRIHKKTDEDGKKAIEAAFLGHTSCKHIFVVDEDIDIYDPTEVEWAFATRFQGDRDMVLKENVSGSSLDPSADPSNKMTTKIGFDLTRPIGAPGSSFKKVKFPEVDMRYFLKE
jgi:2,5-furandicarboxylate decarboxylase 1